MRQTDRCRTALAITSGALRATPARTPGSATPGPVFSSTPIAAKASTISQQAGRANCCRNSMRRTSRNMAALLHGHRRAIVVTHAIDQFVEWIDAGLVGHAIHRHGEGAVAVLYRHLCEIQRFLVLLLA